MLEHIMSLITREENEGLLKMVGEEEISQVVWSLDLDKQGLGLTDLAYIFLEPFRM
jgi:hypothetical protein